MRSSPPEILVHVESRKGPQNTHKIKQRCAMYEGGTSVYMELRYEIVLVYIFA